MSKRLIAFIAIIVLLGAAVWWTLDVNQNDKEEGSTRIQVVTTLFPLYDFARTVGGDYADVTLLLPPGVEAHSYEPTPGDIVRINGSDIFVYTGKFMEPWAEDLLQGTENSDLTVVNASQGIELRDASVQDEDGPAEEGHHHQNDAVDPHIWLDFSNDITIVDTITEAMINADPNHQDDYAAAADTLKHDLRQLDQEYTESLASCGSRTVIYGGHFAFGYLADRYDLDYLAAQGFSPDSEPSADDLVNLVNTIRDNNVQTVFYEELSSLKIAETIASETDVRLLGLNPAPNLSRDDLERGTSFFSIMRDNLDHLTKGLQCQTP